MYFVLTKESGGYEEVFPVIKELSLKGARSRRAQLYVRNRSKWNNFYTFILKNITQQINPDCFLPLSGEFLTKKYISHLSKLVTMSSGKIV